MTTTPDRVTHTGRVPRASRGHVFYQALSTAGGPRRPILFPAPAHEPGPQDPYTTDEKRANNF